MTWLQLGALALVSLDAAASRDQAAIKEEVTVQVQNAAAATYLTDPGVVQVRLADRRLVLPDCQEWNVLSSSYSEWRNMDEKRQV